MNGCFTNDASCEKINRHPIHPGTLVKTVQQCLFRQGHQHVGQSKAKALTGAPVGRRGAIAHSARRQLQCPRQSVYAQRCGPLAAAPQCAAECNRCPPLLLDSAGTTSASLGAVPAQNNSQEITSSKVSGGPSMSTHPRPLSLEAMKVSR